MSGRRSMQREPRPDAGAKYVRRESRSEFVRASFVNKLEEMRLIMKVWRSNGRPTDAFWPDTKVALRNWHDPDKGLFRWGSPNIDSPSGPNKQLVEEWNRLIADAAEIAVGATTLEAENERLKNINRRLGEQLALRTHQVMELLDAVAVLDASHHILSRHSLQT